MIVSDYLFQVLNRKQAHQLDDYTLFDITGSDATSFLQNQTTNNVLTLNENHFHTNCLLTPKGILSSVFILIKVNEQHYKLLVQNNYRDSTYERLDQFLISEDVEIKFQENNYSFVFGKHSEEGIKGKFAGVHGVLRVEKVEQHNDNLQLLKILSGYNELSDIAPNTLFNNSSLINFAYDPKKGCFPGNETISKVESRKGAGFKDTLVFFYSRVELSKGDTLRVEGKKVASVKDFINLSTSENDLTIVRADLLRDYRIDNKKISFDMIESRAIIRNLPFFNDEDKHILLYDRALELFQSSRDEMAIDYLKLALFYKPDFADAYESLAVLLGRHERFSEAIELLDKLVEVDPKSVMAHTNLSMFHMKLGNIEIAEEHKSQATLKSFEKFGEEAELKRAKEAQEKKDKEEQARKEEMFKQVLEIDAVDPLANYGLGEIHFNRKDFNAAKSHLNIVLKEDEKYSVAYLLLGKVYLSLGEKDQARDIFNRGIEIAAKNGDLMPANEMQRFLNEL